MHSQESHGSAFPRLVGRCLDLNSAYKQFGVREEDAQWLCLVVMNPANKNLLYLGTNSLPFGAVGSVCGSLRISTSLWALGLRLLSLLWCSYYDDYPCISRAELQCNTEHATTGLFKLLGVDAPFRTILLHVGAADGFAMKQSRNSPGCSHRLTPSRTG